MFLSLGGRADDGAELLGLLEGRLARLRVGRDARHQPGRQFNGFLGDFQFLVRPI